MAALCRVRQAETPLSSAAFGSAVSSRRGAAAAIIVYDITSTDSFTRAKNWVRELQRQGNPNLIMALAGK